MQPYKDTQHSSRYWMAITIRRFVVLLALTATLLTTLGSHDLMGKGHPVITIDPKKGERYQGIVGLEGDTLAEVLEGYFCKLWNS